MLLFYEFKKLIKNKAVTASMLVLLAVIAIAANAFAATPCGGPYYEPEMPEKLRKN